MTLNLATVENATLALEYNKQIHIFPRGADRARRKDIDYPAILNEGQPLIQAMCKRDMPYSKENIAPASSSFEKPNNKWSSWRNNRRGKGEPSGHSQLELQERKGQGQETHLELQQEMEELAEPSW